MSLNGLIGYTGFVGGQLESQRTFSVVFNSANIAEIAKQEFETLTCAAAPGSMFEANRFPDRDRVKIQALMQELSKVRASRFILISSIAVLEDFAGGDDEGTTAFQKELAYGRHRRALETFVEETFEDSLVVRLPALFGHGLRKNFVFDLLNPIPSMLTKAKLEGLSRVLDRRLFDKLTGLYGFDPATCMLKLDRTALNACAVRAVLEEAVIAYGFSSMQFHNPESSYQYYNINRLWLDIEVSIQAGLNHIHLVSEPLRAADIHLRLTGRDMPESGARQHSENMRTRNAELWGKNGPYLEDADTVLDQLVAFYKGEGRGL